MSADTLIFDLDGTLLNTLGGINQAMNYPLKKCGYKTHTIEETRSFVGNGIKKAFERAVECEISEEEKEKLVNMFKDYYIEHLYEHTKPYDGIIEMLHELKRRKYKTAVLSNKYDDAVKELCSHYFSDCIDAALGECAGLRRKPHFDGIIKLIGQLESKLDNVIFIGDSDVDIMAAHNAGIPCISVLWGFKSRKFLESCGAELFAEKPDDIIKIVSAVK